MKSLIFVLIFLGIVYSKFTEEQYRTAFSEWSIRFEKQYESLEFNYRYNVFKSNMDYIEDWNSQGLSSRLGLTHFADITNLEYQRIYLGSKINTLESGLFDGNSIFRNEIRQSVNESVDWRNKGAVTGVKNQGQCGSCWSFSTTGSVEGAHQIKTGNLVALSEQNLVDCSESEGNLGCNGGLMNYAFEYIMKNNGIDTEESYPYTAETGRHCLYNASNSGATVSSYANVTAGDESDLTAKVSQYGPVSVAIDASHTSFQLYSSGIYYEPKCSSIDLDHGVLVVGYGTDTSDKKPNIRLNMVRRHPSVDEVEVHDDKTHNEYYIVKNSWGSNWGMDGYIWMSRNRNNNCGIASCASVPFC